MGCNNVIDIRGRKNMEKIIGEAKVKAEAEFQAKADKLRTGKFGFEDLFSDDDIVTILERAEQNKFFKGRCVDISRVQKYDKIKKLAQWLDCHCPDILGIVIGGITSRQPHAVVSIDVRRLSALRGRPLQAFCMLFSLSDNVFLSGINGDMIRFSFSVEYVYKA